MSRLPEGLHEEELDAYMEFLDLEDEGDQLSGDDHSSIPEVARQLLVQATSDAVMVGAWYHLVDRLRARKRGSIRAAERAAKGLHTQQSLGRPLLGTPEYHQWVKTTQEGREFHEDREAWEREQEQAMINKMVEVVESSISSDPIEWTDELLDSEIAINNHTKTTWRAATVKQLLERFEMMIRQAAGDAETAAFILKAVRELEAAGVECLGDLIAVAETEGP